MRQNRPSDDGNDMPLNVIHNHHGHESDREIPEPQPESGPRPRPRPRPLNRRVVLKATAAVSAIAAAGGIGASATLQPAVTRAAEGGTTRANRYTSADARSLRTASIEDFVTFEADYPFFALGVNWLPEVGYWPIVEVQVSADGMTWSDTEQLAANSEDGGRPSRENRLFTPLLFTNGETFVRYRTVDAEGNPGTVAGLSFTYIDATDGPWEKDVSANRRLTTASTDDRVPPQIVTREAWRADESYRFDTYGEIWPPEYVTVHHVIIHHTDTPTFQDPLVSIRSIYYYHAVDQGWGDIGYNYLVDRNGTIYEGRYGGQNVVGGHSYEYAFGSSGISIIGDYQDVAESAAAQAGLVAIVSWVGRDLDPYGRQDFLEAPNLPVICAHRDVNSTTCPGNMLYYDVPEIRSLVAATLNGGDLDTNNPGGIAVRDQVIVQTDDGGPLNVRSQADATSTVVGQLADGTRAEVVDGPVVTTDENWYKVNGSGKTGWVSARYLIVSPPEPPPVNEGDYAFGVNIRFTAATNIRRLPTTTSGVIAQIPRDTWAFVLAGPIAAENYDWYQVRAYEIGDGWVIKSNFEPAPVDTAPANAKFVVGDTVEATETINIRPRPGIAETVTATTYAGNQFKITQPPISVTDYIWYGVYGSFGGGWVVENTLKKVTVTPPPAGKFAIGDTIRVTDMMNFRTGPSTSASVLTQLNAGATGTIVGGPTAGNGYTWYQIKMSDGTVGWGVQDWLEKTTVTPPPAGDAKFKVGDTIKVTEAMNFRSTAGTSGSVIAQLPAGTTGTVLAGPAAASGYTWYQFRTSGGTTGWGAQDWLEKSSGTPEPTIGKFAVGDSVSVNVSLNLRSSASTSGSVVAILDTTSTGTIVGGPASGNGYAWYQMKTTGGTTGWCIQDGLDKR
ncbi:MAG: SH3 domain-containing protein [Thermomicrobiales bacterium]